MHFCTNFLFTNYDFFFHLLNPPPWLFTVAGSLLWSTIIDKEIQPNLLTLDHLSGQICPENASGRVQTTDAIFVLTK